MKHAIAAATIVSAAIGALGGCQFGEGELGEEELELELGEEELALESGEGDLDPEALAGDLDADGELEGIELQAALFTFTPAPTSKFIPPHIGGDRDFSGNGPDVEVRTELLIRNDREVWAQVRMHAKESKSDWTEVEGTQDFLLRVHPVPVRIVSGTLTERGYKDSNHSDDTITVGGSELVNRFVCTGDTRGDEAGTRTGVRVHFNAVTLEEQVRDSCVGHCGGSAGECWCDNVCNELGDCCADACSVCGQC